MLEVLVSAIRQERRGEGRGGRGGRGEGGERRPTDQKERKLSPFADHTIVYIENPKASMK